MSWPIVTFSVWWGIVVLGHALAKRSWIDLLVTGWIIVLFASIVEESVGSPIGSAAFMMALQIVFLVGMVRDRRKRDDSDAAGKSNLSAASADSPPNEQ